MPLTAAEFVASALGRRAAQAGYADWARTAGPSTNAPLTLTLREAEARHRLGPARFWRWVRWGATNAAP